MLLQPVAQLREKVKALFAQANHTHADAAVFSRSSVRPLRWR
jgi:hypothetical protein